MAVRAHLVGHVEVGVVSASNVGVYVRVVPLAVQVDQIPAVVGVVDDHAVYVEHLHEHPEGRGEAHAYCGAVLKHTVGLCAVLGSSRDNDCHAALMPEVCAHPVVYGLFLLVRSHAVCNNFVEYLRSHAQRLLLPFVKRGRVPGLVRVGYGQGGAYVILSRDGDVILLLHGV